jgi:hypothetical protein
MLKAPLLLFSITFLVAGCGGKQPAPSPNQAQPTSGSAITAIAKMGNLATDPLAQMSFEFDGNPPKEEIQEKLDKVLGMYRLETNNDNRARAGRTLIALRKEHGHSEMSILDKMLGSPAEGNFEEASRRISTAMNQ